MELSAGRIFIDVDTRKSLVFSKKVQSPEGEETAIKIHYEKLFKHCTYCGLLSHEESYCSKKIVEAREQSAKAGVFARVQVPQVNSSRQTLLSDRNGRGGHLVRRDRIGTNQRDDMEKCMVRSGHRLQDMEIDMHLTSTENNNNCDKNTEKMRLNGSIHKCR
ncbi:Zinc knuckle CX2CX4HX4C protein [Raphanus sativus]|nr:Zinc knuckle CX2CX4HX4C protein [Raphanus sativus]